MNKLLLFFYHHWAVLFLGLILLLIIKSNYTPGTWLIGWDNLLPELNFGPNLLRSIFAVWQEHQGLGLVGGMAHATDLIRQLLLAPFVLFLPSHLIRYLWHFSMLVLGTFGIFRLTRSHFKFTPFIALLSSLFYLLNWGTLQYFWAPYESFSTFWGFFPWLIYQLLTYLAHPSRPNLIRLAIFNLLAIPSFYVPTLFIVYLLCVLCVFLSFLILDPKSYFLNQSKILLLIFLINAFWLLPFTYFFITSGNNPQTTLGNIISTPEMVARNQHYGTPLNFLSLKNYLFSYSPPDSSSSFMSSWDSYTSNPDIIIITLILGLIILLGLTSSPIWLKSFFLLSSLALLSTTPPFSYLNQLFRHSSLLDQIFRNSFTKFVVPTAFSFSILLAYGLRYLQLRLASTQSIAFLPPILNIFVLLSLLIISQPSFYGNLISPTMKSKIPQAYFQLFDYFHTQPPHVRVLHLPAGSFWGWTNYRWGPSTSGFLWYGISQPILDRNFDMWQASNEQFYWELDYALQSRNQLLFELLLQKYAISYIIFDDNIYYPNQPVYARLSLFTQGLLDSSSKISLTHRFDNITIYQVNHPTPLQQISNSPHQPTPPSLYNFLATKKFPLSAPPPQLTNKPIYQSNTLRLFSSSNYPDFTPISIPDITLNQSYVLVIVHRHLQGLPLRLSAYSTSQDFLYFDTQLSPSSTWQTSYFILPRLSDTPISGLTILFNNPAFSRDTTTNQIQSISLIPYNNSALAPTTLSSSPALLFTQAYHPGWLAFYFDGLRPVFLPDHTTANSWANAWSLPVSSFPFPVSVHILFWPQLLQFLGFLLFVPLFLFIRKQANLPHHYVLYRKSLPLPKRLLK